MQFEYDPEFLIMQISKRPGIWDYEHPDYRSKNTRMRLWSEVVKELMQTEGEVPMTKGQKRELELQLQKKWKSIRDCFQKYLTNPSRTKRAYIYSKQLQFLLKDEKLPKRKQFHIKKSDDTDETEEDVEEDNEESPAKRSRSMVAWKKSKMRVSIGRNKNDSDEENVTYEANDGYESAQDSLDTKPNISTHHNIDASQFAFANVDLLPSKDSEDPDKMFLLSLLPHLKTLPEEFRLNAKMELMQVLQQANYSVSKLI